jgi:hypothetical protein
MSLAILFHFLCAQHKQHVPKQHGFLEKEARWQTPKDITEISVVTVK